MWDVGCRLCTWIFTTERWHDTSGALRMDADVFDALARSLTSAGSRRRALAVALGAPLAVFGLTETEARRKKNKKKKKKKNGGGAAPPVVPPPPVDALAPCPDGRAVCGDGTCCSRDKDCVNVLGFIGCSCPGGTSGCTNQFCLSTTCPVVVDLGVCACQGACQDGRSLCGGTCCSPSQECQGGTCACPAGAVECQPSSCASATCPNGTPRNTTTCVCAV
jgi:hypothetical protein